MTPEVERFLELATRELESQPELREEAKGELMARVNHQGMPLEMLDLSEPIARLEGVKKRKRWLRRTLHVVGLMLLLLVIGLGVGLLVRNTVFLVQAQMMGSRYGVLGGVPAEDLGVGRWVRRTAPELPFSSQESAELAALLARNPGDRTIFPQYLLRLEREQGAGWAMSAEDVERAKHLDPENGFYSFVQIDSHLNRAFGGRASSRTSPPSSSVVSDEAEFAKALELFSEAANAEYFSDYSGDLRRKQLAAFPRAEGFLEDALHEMFTEQVIQLFGNYTSTGEKSTE
ncbi:hypothetical protein ACFQY0_10245 [Haloferula chungangensis]|uniref:Uncharacterized protein n=1 Tax=Haloferula chungangensis TaxID=1048331 RepID=A0ABW2L5B4_9BACT